MRVQQKERLQNICAKLENTALFFFFPPFISRKNMPIARPHCSFVLSVKVLSDFHSAVMM